MDLAAELADDAAGTPMTMGPVWMAVKQGHKEAKRRRVRRALEKAAAVAEADDVERVVAELAAEEQARRRQQIADARREPKERWQRGDGSAARDDVNKAHVSLVRTMEVLVVADGNHDLADNAEASDGLSTATMMVDGEQRMVKIDSGARYSVAGTDWMMRGEQVKRAAPVDCVEGIGGFLLDVLGLWTYRMQNVFRQTVEVMACIFEGCTREFLVGVDFLEKHRTVLDFEGGELCYDERGQMVVIPFYTDNNGDESKAASVRLAGAANLERRAVQLVEVAIAAPKGEEGVFIPTFKTGAVLLAPAVTKVRNGKALVPAVNAYGG
ncbi:hypothetical protein P3T76_015556 [Phytophthora citrophthora]|uniref:Peptidase A2 domain-containing protein n=1 Tax=Phytophthora citrophthora TaxID=4793 RepID=A0AAD9FZB1_9STRA|nr:hypothetical protein P3T76_015556 [Phytophthora citrophthora]